MLTNVRGKIKWQFLATCKNCHLPFFPLSSHIISQHDLYLILPFFGCRSIRLLPFHLLDADSEPAGAGQMHLQRGLGIDFLRGDGICLHRILHLDIADAVGLRGVGIDRGGVLDPFLKEIQRELQITSVLIGDSTDEPVTLLALPPSPWPDGRSRCSLPARPASTCSVSSQRPHP